MKSNKREQLKQAFRDFVFGKSKPKKVTKKRGKK